ncbi:hypothetical protein C8J28_11452 [Cereibacter azotoformans]|uniref:Uncharacterized protein n=2 Tax=Cereibacter azotoformans TaxID=43057 RepID=A0A2T5JYT0_9RHOB|nr:hypothetical protein C8J28_11452 [Cereibacter azotoformans]
MAGIEGVALKGKGAADRMPEACATAQLVILAARHEGPVPPGCQLIDQSVLARTGALAIWPEAEGLRMVPARADRRLWSGRP